MEPDRHSAGLAPLTVGWIPEAGLETRRRRGRLPHTSPRQKLSFVPGNSLDAVPTIPLQNIFAPGSTGVAVPPPGIEAIDEHMKLGYQ